MHDSNHWYGHSRILGRYCGFADDTPRRIRGLLQHGWQADERGHGYPRFAWSEALRRRAWSAGRRGHYVIGAPWIYLLDLEPGRAARREGALWYPGHADDRHADLAAEIADVEAGPVTVCLARREFADPAVRRVYAAKGFRVICLGARGSRWDASGRGFLRAQLAEMRRHRRVCSTRLGSMLFYGASAGCEVGVYGGVPEPGPWPELRGVRTDPEAAGEAARQELGFAYRATPEELRRVFGWKRGRSA